MADIPEEIKVTGIRGGGSGSTGFAGGLNYLDYGSQGSNDWYNSSIDMDALASIINDPEFRMQGVDDSTASGPTALDTAFNKIFEPLPDLPSGETFSPETGVNSIDDILYSGVQNYGEGSVTPRNLNGAVNPVTTLDPNAASQDDIDALVALLNSEGTTVEDVGATYGIDPALVQAQLDIINATSGAGDVDPPVVLPPVDPPVVPPVAIDTTVSPDAVDTFTSAADVVLGMAQSQQNPGAAIPGYGLGSVNPSGGLTIPTGPLGTIIAKGQDALNAVGDKVGDAIDEVFRILRLPNPTKIIGAPKQKRGTIVWGQTGGNPVINTGTTGAGTQTGMTTGSAALDAVLNKMTGVLTGKISADQAVSLPTLQEILIATAADETGLSTENIQDIITTAQTVADATLNVAQEEVDHLLI